MSQDIVTIRRQVKMVSSSLRQEKPVPAVQAVIATLRLMLSTPLMKSEKDEFAALVREAVSYLNNDPAIRKLYPLELVYTHGEEKRLYDDLQELLDVLKDATMSEVEEITRAMEAKKTAALTKGQEHLDARDYDGARAVFGAISREYAEDDKLKGDIGEKFLGAGLYEDAAEYFADALTLNPNVLRTYNRLAIALRKLERFDVAEEYYMRALPLAPDDPNLLFNIGRLYLDWGKWSKAVEYGEKAYAVHPEFVEAQKLANFARKKMA